MKKNYIIFFFLFSCLFYAGCNKKITENEKILEKCEEQLNLETVISDDLELPTLVNGVSIIWVSSYPQVLNNEGIVNLPSEDTIVDLVAILNYQGNVKEINFQIKVLSQKKVYEQAILKFYDELEIPKTLDSDFVLPTNHGEISIIWYANNQRLDDNHIKVEKQNFEQILTLNAKFTLKTFTLLKEYQIKIPSFTNGEIMENAYLLFLQDYEKGINHLKHTYDDVSFSWTFNNDQYINEDGSFNYDDDVHPIVMTVEMTYLGEVVFKEISFVIPKMPNDVRVQRAIANLQLPTETKEDLVLPTSLMDVNIKWESKTIFYINNEGIIKRSDKDLKAKLVATFSYLDYVESVTYNLKIMKYTEEEILAIVMSDVVFPKTINANLDLPYYLDYEVFVKWSSNNKNIIADNGEVSIPQKNTIVILEATFIKGSVEMKKEFTIEVIGEESLINTKPHQIKYEVENFQVQNLKNLEIVDNGICLKEDALEGTYESEIIDTMNFSSLVASWAATSSVTGTVELELKVLVNGVWSDFISYGEWGRGRENKCYDQNKNLIKLNEDEVQVMGNGFAQGIIFRVTLRRTAGTLSPILRLVSFALENTSYQYPVNIENIPSSKIYDVPKLNQNIVPTIGNKICSATTSTMLLKYKGEDFSSFDEYEHRYIASIVKEYNSGIYGNWVYNTVAIGSYGYRAYVARMYSIEELLLHLANVGPVGLSVKGQMTSNEKNYYTNGHLIVCVGYKYVDGKLYILCNDPNVANVYCEYPLDIIQKTWRNIAYIVE